MARLLFVVDLDPSNPVPDEHIEDVLQPDPHEIVVRVTRAEDASMEALAARASVFPSRGQARKNGFCGPIPFGFGLWGTEAGNFFVWNPIPPSSPPTIGRRRNLTEQWWNFLDSMRATGRVGSWSLPDDWEALRETWRCRRKAGTWEEPFSPR